MYVRQEKTYICFSFLVRGAEKQEKILPEMQEKRDRIYRRGQARRKGERNTERGSSRAS